MGSEGLRRLNELDGKIAAAKADSNKNADVAKLKQIALAEAEKPEKGGLWQQQSKRHAVHCLMCNGSLPHVRPSPRA